MLLRYPVDRAIGFRPVLARRASVMYSTSPFANDDNAVDVDAKTSVGSAAVHSDGAEADFVRVAPAGDEATGISASTVDAVSDDVLPSFSAVHENTARTLPSSMRLALLSAVYFLRSVIASSSVRWHIP